MFRFLIAFSAVCIFSIASAGVAEAGGGGGGDGAGGGKGGGKAGSIEITNNGPDAITVFYRVQQGGTPATAGDLLEFPSIEINPNATRSINSLEAGSYELAAAASAFVALGDDNPDQPIPGKTDGDPGFRVVEVEDDSVTEVTVDEDLGSFGFAGITSATITAND